MDAAFDVEDMFMAGAEPEPVEPTNKAEGAEQDEATTENAETEAAEAEVDAASADAEPEAQAEEPAAEADAETLKALKPKAIKRFNQMLSQRDEALAEARQAKAERDALKAQIEQRQNEPVAVVKASDPLAKVTNLEQLEAHESYWENVRLWCLANLNGGVPPKELSGGDGETELPPRTVVENLARAEAIIKAAPKKREFLESFRAERAKAREAAPDMFRAGTPENKAAVDYQRKLLNFEAQADQDLIIAKLLKVDRMEREEREGIRYTRVETKKPDPKTAPVALKPLPKPAPSAARTPVVRASGTLKTLAEKLAAGPQDVEALFDMA